MKLIGPVGTHIFQGVVLPAHQIVDCDLMLLSDLNRDRNLSLLSLTYKMTASGL